MTSEIRFTAGWGIVALCVLCVVGSTGELSDPSKFSEFQFQFLISILTNMQILNLLGRDESGVITDPCVKISACVAPWQFCISAEECRGPGTCHCHSLDLGGRESNDQIAIIP